MPLFEYTAKDESGRRVQGMLAGDTWQNVETELRQRGLELTAVSEVKPSEPQPPQSSSAPPGAAAVPIQSAQPVQRAPQASAQPTAAGSRSQQATSQSTVPSSIKTGASAPPSIVRTRAGSDRNIMFLFTQMASYFHSGQSPSVAFSNLANSWLALYRPALLDMADAASAGRSVADEMVRYPFLFPPHVVGVYRAGELGGFLPEACLSIANQAQESYRYRKLFMLLALIFWFVIGGIPVAFWGARGLETSLRRMDATGGTEPGPTVVAQSFGTTALPVLVATALALVVTYCLYKLWSSMKLRTVRHRMTLAVPTVGKRARMESMALFSWVLANLTRVGLSPRAATEIAASAVPNVHLSHQLAESAKKMRSETKLSDAIAHIRLMTPEMKVMIQTGEMVGDLPRQLEMVAQAQRDDFLHYQKQTHFRVGCWAVLLMMFGTCVIGAWFQRMYYDSLFRVILGEGEPQVQTDAQP